MKRKAYQVVVPVTLVVVMMAFLAAIFFANANLSFAASGNKKSSAVARTLLLSILRPRSNSFKAR